MGRLIEEPRQAHCISCLVCKTFRTPIDCETIKIKVSMFAGINNV